MDKLTDIDFFTAAHVLDCDVATVKALAEVESAGAGFLPSGIPKILFEAHIFSRLTNHKYDKTYPSISSKTWNKKLYVGGEGEHRRLQVASKLDREAALQATSWGMFQLMGFNWKACGYKNLQEFINDMFVSSYGQLRGFIGFIRNNKKLLSAVQKRAWKTVALLYNGAGYRENKYDEKLEQAYKKFS
jgi:Protein of unknown function (DUF3380).